MASAKPDPAQMAMDGGEEEVLDEMEKKVHKYSRGKASNLGALRDKKLKGQLAAREKLYGHSAKAAAQAEQWLLPTGMGCLEPYDELEKTNRYPQSLAVKEVDLLSSIKPFDMILPLLGPYTIGYTGNGQYMVVGGQKGHVAMMDMLNL